MLFIRSTEGNGKEKCGIFMHYETSLLQYSLFYKLFGIEVVVYARK